MAKTETSRLVEVVTQFDEELKRFEYLCGEAERVNMTSEKALRRAAKASSEAAESQQKIAQLMGEFASALAEARERNETAQQRLQAREQEIILKDQQLKAFLSRFAMLGEAAKQVSEAITLAVTTGGGAPGDGATPVNALSPEGPMPNAEALMKVDDLIAKFLDEAKILVDDTRTADMADLAKDVETLRKHIQTARNKLGAYAERVQN